MGIFLFHIIFPRTIPRGYKHYCKRCSGIYNSEREKQPEVLAKRREYNARRALREANDPHWDNEAKRLGRAEANRRYNASPITKLKRYKRKCEKKIAKWQAALESTTRELDRMLAERGGE